MNARSGRWRWTLLLIAVAMLAGLGLPGEARGRVGAPPAALKLDPFYQKYLSAGGLPIVGSARVRDEALVVARRLVLRMTRKRPDVLAELVRKGVRVAIMAQCEVTVDIPEHRDLYAAFPGTDWNARARGLGATEARPACAGAEENLLGLPGDPYRGESILMHEFAHTMRMMGLRTLDPKLDQAITAAYAAAKKDGLWKRTYAATNSDEYWAEGVQDWFDANTEAIPANGVHNTVNTRAELQAYDSRLARLIARVFDEGRWRYRYPRRNASKRDFHRSG